MYLTGYPFPSHLPSAVDYLTQAAGAGDARSQFQLGLLYLSGEGVEKDVPKGVGLLEASIDKYSFDESGVRISTRPGEDVERLKSMAETTVEVVLPPAVVDLKFGTGR
ncbi:tetratricopeptide repeat protein [Vibrio owensii]|uniref:tetratricopeptide repeat protein n=1 Tax=Vibrio owensii TaxID=696485 RepID=UPI001A7EFC8D|nr:sel1 repeat family protein [Vibrio owensii]